MRNFNKLFRGLVVLSQSERLPLHALANNTAADALRANARGCGSAFRLFDMHRLQIDEIMPFADTGRLAAVATEVFGLPAFNLGVASASGSFTNFAHATHDFGTLIETEICPPVRFKRREYIDQPPTCKTGNGSVFIADARLQSRWERMEEFRRS